MPPTPSVFLAMSVAALSCTELLFAQCEPLFVAGASLPGVDGQVRAVTSFDPDGPGPAGVQLVLAGDFAYAGTTAAANIVAFDPMSGTWSPLGSGVDDSVNDLLVTPGGDLLVAGQFRRAGHLNTSGVARWDGVQWHELAGGLTALGLPFYFGAVAHDLALAPDGSVLVGGSFHLAGDVVSPCIARWDGAAWSALQQGIDQLAVRAVAVMPDGGVVAGGNFLAASGTPVANLARFDGSQWSALGAVDGAIELVVLFNGELVVAGPFSSIDGVALPGLARYDGSTWSGLGSGPGFMPNFLSVEAAGTLLACGNGGVARFDGQGWQSLSGPVAPDQVQVFRSINELPDGTLVVGGQFRSVDGVAAMAAARFDGASWSPLSSGTDGAVHALLSLADGRYVAGGTFTRIADRELRHLALWDGGVWQALGEGVDGPVYALAQLDDGAIAVAGSFTTAGVASAANVAIWRDGNWQSLDGGLSTSSGSVVVTSLAALPGGRLVVGGRFSQAGGVAVESLAQWNGSAWQAIDPGQVALVTALAAAPDGALLIAGNLALPGSPLADRVVRYDGAGFTAFGDTFAGPVHALLPRRDGAVVAAGGFGAIGSTPAAHLAQWNGSDWNALAGGLDGIARGLLELPDGDLLVAGAFGNVGGIAAAGIVRLDGNNVAPFGGELAFGSPRALALADSQVLVGGSFRAAGGLPSAGIARAPAPCAAALRRSLVACGLPVELDALPPWRGATWQAAANVDSRTWVLAVGSSKQLALPLQPWFGAAARDCQLGVLPEVVVSLPVVDGVASLRMSIADSPAVIGTRIQLQFVALQLTAGGPRIGVSDSLSATVGEL